MASCKDNHSSCTLPAALISLRTRVQGHSVVLIQPFDSNVHVAVVVVMEVVVVVVVVVVAAAVFVITCFSQHTASASPFRRVSHRCSADCHSFT
jgi:hypothetical protein